MNIATDRLSVRSFRKLLLGLLLFLLATVLPAAELIAGNWPMERRSTFISFGYRGFSGQQYYGPAGELRGMHRLEEQSLSFSSEYGYSKYVSAIVQLPAFRKLYAQVDADAPLLSVQSPGDIDLGMRFTAWAGDDDVFSLTALFGIPLGETTQNKGLWAGDDEYNQLLLLRYGHLFESIGAHVHVETGYNFRSNGYADELHFAAEAGFRPIDPLVLKFHLRSVAGQGNGDADFLGGQFGFSSNNQRYIMYGPEAEVWLTGGMGVNLGLYNITDARNMTGSAILQSGVFFLLAPVSGR